MNRNPAIENLLEVINPGQGELKAASKCVFCKKEVDLDKLEEIDQLEYNISGVCPSCWNDMASEMGIEERE